MSNPLTSMDFASFFESVHGFAPFPWQQRLAEAAGEGDWPTALALPTASGKTAVLDVAVFALAARDGDAPRRIFMTVDRRLVVDQAHRHAERIRDALRSATGGIVKRVADRLRALAGGDADRDAWPLLVARLRGGLPDERLWCRSPLQPTIVSTTVDQIGSRLLFRGYGVSPRAWPIHAGLVGSDSLVILDEAHCSEPFRQTLATIRREQERGAEARCGLRPIRTIDLSATPRSPGRSLSLSEADRGHPVLGRRLHATKPIDLEVVKGSLAQASDPPEAKDAIATEVAERLSKVLAPNLDGTVPPLRAAVVVNRVDRARRTAALLEAQFGAGVDIRLMVGAMRPIDRDRLDAELRERVGSGNSSPSPLVVVATQCLEVGADLDFDLMLSELAPLDALRQRFGRLNRTGRPITANGAVLAAESRIRKPASNAEPDPVYGTADVAAWEVLESLATEVAVAQARGKARNVRRCDFGIEAMDGALSGLEEARRLAALTPSSDAPCLLPAHLDALAQTNPAPAASPEPGLYLHGAASDAAEIAICFRSDLPPMPEDDGDAEALEAMAAYLALLPPIQRECLPVRLATFRRWWREHAADDADVPIADDDEPRARPRKAEQESSRPLALMVPSGEGDPCPLQSPSQLQPGDLLLVPTSPSASHGSAAKAWDRLGHVPPRLDWPSLDCADEAWDRDDRPPRVRVTAATLRTLAAALAVELPRELAPSTSEVWRDDGEGDWVEPVRVWLASVEQHRDAAGASPMPATFARRSADLLLDLLGDPRSRPARHPSGGGVFFGTIPPRSASDTPPSLVLPEELSPGTATIASHSEGVASLVSRFAAGLSLEEAIREAMLAAGLWHDLGKADPRFQALLRGGAGFGELLAKSPRRFVSDRSLRDRAGWPRGGRHEAISLAAIEAASILEPERDWLALHLVATHHGAARPFLPAFDAPLEAIDAELHERRLEIDASSMRLPDARTAERFWRAIEAFGPWGTALLEAIFRLADARRSEAEADSSIAAASHREEVAS